MANANDKKKTHPISLRLEQGVVDAIDKARINYKDVGITVTKTDYIKMAIKEKLERE